MNPAPLLHAGTSRLMKPAALVPSLHRAAGCSVRPVVLARDVKQGREYREADDKLIEADGSKGKPSGLYADEVLAQQAAAPPKKENLSQEMKARLREEYIGLGGTANQGSVPMPMRAVIAAGLLVEEEARTSTGSSATSSSSSSSSTGKVSGSKFVIDENEVLSSTWEHRLWTWGPISLMGATLLQAANQVQGPADLVTLGASVLVAYVLSDFGTGVYHFGVDNYGGPETPVFGRQIAAFQGHHQRPWTITQREFCNNVHQVFKPAGTPAALFLLASGFMPLWWNAFASSFLFLICMSQQFHAWSHMKKSELPGYVVALQDAGVLISRKQHGAHHKPPFCNNYCIVSGLWNDVLDHSGFFTTLEKVIHERTGIEPRSWNEPEYNGWSELQAQTAGTSTADEE